MIMDTKEHRTAIRENYTAGHEEGVRLLATVSNESERHRLEIETAQNLIASDGLEYSHQQGVWHTVSIRPLCYVRIDMEEGVSHE